ncbi:hypothetical protein, partial [Bradyrhizobium oropedii]|uniref:hypothetical protein n=1 Tax=Bradyrhizobium oropedii TaxID=1571201 RepID=UPI0030843C51
RDRGTRRALQSRPALYQAHVRVGDEETAPVRDEGMAGLADPDLSDDVPDEFEIDLGDCDTGFARREARPNFALTTASAEIAG